jgi:hypothetical protein
MFRARFVRRLPLRWLAAGLFAAGCSHIDGERKDYDPLDPDRRAAVSPYAGNLAAAAKADVGVRHVVFHAPDALNEEFLNGMPAAPAAKAATAPGSLTLAVAPLVVPINLDTVLQMTTTGNAKIALGRKQVEEVTVCERSHHLGGSDEGCCGDGFNLLALLGRHASAKRLETQAKVFQQQAELAKTINETLLDAGNTYIDYLTARNGESVGRELQGLQDELYKRALDLQKTDRSATVLVEGIETELSARRQAVEKLHQQSEAALAKLKYLTGVAPESELEALDKKLEVIDLVDPQTPAAELIAKAQAQGPGVRELEGLIGTIQEGLAEATGLKTLLPKAACKIKVAENRLEQAELSLKDVRGKLAAGVQEARAASLSGREQVKQAVEAIRHAAENYRLSDLRLKQNAQGSSNSEVLQSIRGRELAYFNYLTAVAEYDKAQLRLLLLLGGK